MKPSIFIGSSSEALGLAKLVKEELSSEFHVDIWSEHLFELGQDTLDSLLLFVQCYDFAILVVSADDFIKSRGKGMGAPRDNVIFELGLFIGALGRRRTFSIICPSKKKLPKLPSDLAGNTTTYLPKNFPISSLDF